MKRYTLKQLEIDVEKQNEYLSIENNLCRFKIEQTYGQTDLWQYNMKTGQSVSRITSGSPRDCRDVMYQYARMWSFTYANTFFVELYNGTKVRNINPESVVCDMVGTIVSSKVLNEVRFYTILYTNGFRSTMTRAESIVKIAYQE